MRRRRKRYEAHAPQFAQQVHRFPAILRQQHAIALPLQSALRRAAHQGFIVRHQNRARAAERPRPRPENFAMLAGDRGWRTLQRAAAGFSRQSLRTELRRCTLKRR